MARKLFVAPIVILLVLLGTSPVMVQGGEPGPGYPWKHHQPPFDFKFGAMIDSHQQSRINAAGILQGFIYIQLTGDTTADGIPIAEKATCSSGTCSVGWVIKGVPVTAKLVHVAPRVWLVDPGDLPKEPGYTHFQWVGPPKTPHQLVVGNTYEGYLLKRVAAGPFYWLGGGEGGPGGGGGCGGGETGGGCGGGETGGCGGETGGGETGGGGGETGGGETGGCGGEDGTDTGGCSGHDGGDMGGGSGHAGGSDGRLVPGGVDPHANIVTVWTGDWTGGCGGDDGGTCEGH